MGIPLTRIPVTIGSRTAVRPYAATRPHERTAAQPNRRTTAQPCSHAAVQPYGRMPKKSAEQIAQGILVRRRASFWLGGVSNLCTKTRQTVTKTPRAALEVLENLLDVLLQSKPNFTLTLEKVAADIELCILTLICGIVVVYLAGSFFEYFEGFAIIFESAEDPERTYNINDRTLQPDHRIDRRVQNAQLQREQEAAETLSCANRDCLSRGVQRFSPLYCVEVSRESGRFSLCLGCTVAYAGYSFTRLSIPELPGVTSVIIGSIAHCHLVNAARNHLNETLRIPSSKRGQYIRNRRFLVPEQLAAYNCISAYSWLRPDWLTWREFATGAEEEDY